MTVLGSRAWFRREQRKSTGRSYGYVVLNPMKQLWDERLYATRAAAVAALEKHWIGGNLATKESPYGMHIVRGRRDFHWVGKGKR